MSRLRLFRVYGQEERKGAPAAHFTIHPDLTAMSLDQSLGDCKTEPHSGGGRIHTHELLKNLLVILRRDSVARIGDAYENAVQPRSALAAALFRRSRVGSPAFPEVGFRP